ncbi:MAG TPA: hypothetical protein VLC71_05395 [Thermomonas sp.]|nr:hypothetical protein [Thermomonas sp.]
MKMFATTVVELRQRFERTVETHPFECGWADEAIVFVEPHDAAPGDVVTLRVQLSPDGIRWIDEGTLVRVTEHAMARLTNFGGFLRLVGVVTDGDGAETGCTLTIRIALKG